MAKFLKNDSDDNILKTNLKKLIQSGHINFLIGSGASYPSIPIAGNIEEEINNLLL